MKKFTIVGDVGGTFTKMMLVDTKERIMLGEVTKYPSHSNMDKDFIVNNFARMVIEHIEMIEENKGFLQGIVLAFPGPFDYTNGICLIDDGKFKSIKGIKIGDEISKKISQVEITSIRNKKIKILFENDARLFAIGESTIQNTPLKSLYITIGTGTGSTFIEENRVIEGLKNEGYVYNYKFKKGVVDDYISKRGIARIASKYGFSNKIEIEELYHLGKEGNPKAIEIFKEFGGLIGEMIEEISKIYQFEFLVLGGQISKSFSLFEKNMFNYLVERNIDITIKYSGDTSYSVLLGAIRLFDINKGGNSE